MYANLWFTNNQQKQIDNNINLFLYNEEMRIILNETPHIQPHIIEMYKGIACFKIVRHHTYIQARRDTNMEWLITMFICSKDNIAQIINDWDPTWIVPLT